MRTTGLCAPIARSLCEVSPVLRASSVTPEHGVLFVYSVAKVWRGNLYLTVRTLRAFPIGFIVNSIRVGIDLKFGYLCPRQFRDAILPLIPLLSYMVVTLSCLR